MNVTNLFLGAVAGGIATVPMTVTMKALHRQLPAHERYALPPREITETITEKAGMREQRDESDHQTAALVAHFGYGMGAGAVYASLAEKYRSSPGWEGVAFGLAVWGVSYLGILPGLGLLQPATEHPPRRTALMLAAHIVWGSATGILVDSFQRLHQQE